MKEWQAKRVFRRFFRFEKQQCPASVLGASAPLLDFQF
ncbi:hypothetical protein WCP94_003588 [Bilophila wadsworthia]